MSGESKAIHPSLRLVVYKINIAEGGTQAYEAVKNEYSKTTTVDGKEICLQSLGEVQSPNLVEDFLNFQFSDHVAVQDIHSGSIALAGNDKARNTMWQWIKANWETVEKKLSGNSVVIDRYLKRCLQEFANYEVERDIAKFFHGKNTKGYDRGLVQVSDAVVGNANYQQREKLLLSEWLKVHGYA